MLATASKINIDGHFNGNSPPCNWQEQGFHPLYHKNQPLSLLSIALFHTFKTYFPSSLQNISKLHVVAWSYEQSHTRVAIILIYPLLPHCRNKCNKIRSIGSDTYWIIKVRAITRFFSGARAWEFWQHWLLFWIICNTPTLSEVILVLKKWF